MAENNNCITINFPEGSGGHMLGRVLMSCNNVAWYDHKQNGEFPWIPYNAPEDELFSRLHFNKRFRGAADKGNKDPNRIPPVLSVAESRGIKVTKEEIDKWKEKLYPYNFVYTLHDKLDETKKFFNPAKHVVVLPDDIDLMIERWKNSSYYYYRDPKDKSYLSRDFYKDKAKSLGITMRQALRNDFEDLLSNYAKHLTEDDVIINDVNLITDYDYFTEVCKKLDLVVNPAHYQKVIKLFKEESHF